MSIQRGPHVQLVGVLIGNPEPVTLPGVDTSSPLTE